MNYFFSVPSQFAEIAIEYVNAISGNEFNFDMSIQIPPQNEAPCVNMNIAASNLTLILTNFELAPCMKVVVYGSPQQSCEKPSQDVCAMTYQADNTEVVLKEDKCESSCLDGFTGDPYDLCYKDEGYTPPVNTPIGAYDPPTARPECLVNSDCISTMACGLRFTCYDPCVGSCGINASCTVINHRPSCSCLDSLVGDPYTECHPSQPFVDPCEPNPCGKGALPLRSTGRCECFCPYQRSQGYQSPIGSFPHYTECRPECVVSSDCPLHLSCSDHVCLDPCNGTCGRGATCTVVNHSPMCSCQPGDPGNPLVQCQYLAPTPYEDDYGAPQGLVVPAQAEPQAQAVPNYPVPVPRPSYEAPTYPAPELPEAVEVPREECRQVYRNGNWETECGTRDETEYIVDDKIENLQQGEEK